MPESVVQILARGEPSALSRNRPIDVGTRTIVVETSLKGLEAECVLACGFGRKLAVVSDPVTREVLGERVEAALAGRHDIASIVLGDPLVCDMQAVARVAKEAATADALIAVGSGTINDIVKLAAAGAGRPYAVFATAPSMNGYVSANAAVYVKGLKSTKPARPPAGAFFDLEVLAGAPPRLIRAGLGDSLCRSTAQADWLMSHIVWETPYDDLPYWLLARDEDDLIAMAPSLTRGDRTAMRHLVDTLILAGFGMTAVGSSAPGSQGEHLISHYADMRGNANGHTAFHGEQIAVTTMTMSILQDAILSGQPPEIVAGDPTPEELAARFGAEIGPACWEELRAKPASGETVNEVNHRLASRWTDVQRRLSDVIRQPAAIRKALQQAGAPLSHNDAGWSRDFYVDAVRHAREVRRRYTFLDIACGNGLLDNGIDRFI